jgi:hypothetical protein
VDEVKYVLLCSGTNPVWGLEPPTPTHSIGASPKNFQPWMNRVKKKMRRKGHREGSKKKGNSALLI